MTVRVLLFARYAELAGTPELEIDLDPDRTVGELWDRVRERCPGLRPVSETPLVACDQAYSDLTKAITGSKEVAFFPPVSGG